MLSNEDTNIKNDLKYKNKIKNFLIISVIILCGLWFFFQPLINLIEVNTRLK